MLQDIENRSKWDRSVLEGTVLHRYSNYFITFRTVVHVPIIENRDFVEKMIVYKFQDDYYIYYSSIPDTYCPKRKGYTRGYTMYALNKITRLNDKILVRTCTQKDPQASMSGFMTLGMIGGKSADNITNFRIVLMKRIRSIMRNAK